MIPALIAKVPGNKKTPADILFEVGEKMRHILKSPDGDDVRGIKEEIAASLLAAEA
jgi:hypothetical protein